MIYINLKTYRESLGDNSVKLALAAELASEETHVPIVPVVSAVDLWRVTQHTQIPVWIQHVDPHKQGQSTGFTTIEGAITAGAHGTILNHSEHQMPFESVKKTVGRIRETDANFKIMICVPDTEKLHHAATLSPDYLAYEPPELIGSEHESVATAKADIIAQAVQKAGIVPVIVGAGIKSKEDIQVSLEKGARGVLIASAIVKSDNPKDKLIDLARAFSKS